MRLFGMIVAVLISLLLLMSCTQPATVKGIINTQEQVELPRGCYSQCPIAGCITS